MRYYEFIVEYKTEVTKGRFKDAILKKLRFQDHINTGYLGGGTKISDWQRMGLTVMGFRPDQDEKEIWSQLTQELYDQHKEEIVNDFLKHMERVDPTPNNQYVPYLVKWYVNSGEIGSYAFPDWEDATSTLKESLIMFYKLRERIPERYRDISQYESASDFMNSTYALQDQYGKQEKLDPGDTEVIYDSKYATIYWPKDEEGSCYLGQGTQWCTASTRSANYFNQYNKDGPLLIINMKDKIRTYDGWSIDDDGGEHEDPDGERVVNRIQAHMEVDSDGEEYLGAGSWRAKKFWTWGDIADPQDNPVDFSTLYDDNPNYKAMWDSPEFQKAMDDVCEKWWDYNGLELQNSPNGD